MVRTAIQPQNIPRVHIEDLDNAIALVKKKDKTGLIEAYGDDVLDTVSQLIRSAIIAPKGCMLVDADFSAIEARVISWLADEKCALMSFVRTVKSTKHQLHKCSMFL